jgi:hypothetical protein
MSHDRLADFERRDGGQTMIRSRRPKRKAAFDVQRLYLETIDRPNNPHYYAMDLREVMQKLVDGHINSTLGSFTRKIAQEYGESAIPSADDHKFGYTLATMFPTYAKASEITALSHVLVAKGVEAYYSEGEIAKYMCKAVNRLLNVYGVHAKIESKAIVLYMAHKFSRKEALELIEDIDTRSTS